MNCVLYWNPTNPKHQALLEALQRRGYKVETKIDYASLRLEYLGRTFYSDEISIHFFCGQSTWQNQS